MQNSGPVPRMAMEDLEAWGGGQLTITNPNAFRVGENLATRKGKSYSKTS
jgi:hypothetical protein